MDSSIMQIFSENLELFEAKFEGVEKWKIILGAASMTTGALLIHDLIQNRSEYIKEIKAESFRLMTKIPSIKKKIEEELEKSRKDIEMTIYEKGEKEMICFTELPNTGKSHEEIIEMTKETFKLGKYNWNNGRVSGGVNTGSNSDYTAMMKEVYRLCSWSNPLHADIFPGIRKMEAEIVRMTANIFNADDEVVGCVTTGGTESLVMMMKAYRNWAKDKLGIKYPEVVAASTIHAGVDKGAELLGMKLVKVSIEKESGKISLSAVRKAINRNTCLVIGSAPEYAHGIIDDIGGLSKIALKKQIGLHVDACLGGYILPFMEEAGYPLDLFDFRLPGVTSISADTHKYGNCPKGTSVIMYRHEGMIHYQYFSVPNWPGGIYATPTISGSRAGANVAVCWAALTYFGKEGYVNIARNIISIARSIKQEIRKIPGLFLFGDPMASVVSFGSDQFNIYKVADVMGEKGWHLQPLQYPRGIHIFLTSLHVRDGIVEDLIADLHQAVQVAKSESSVPSGGIAKLYGMAHSLPEKLVEKAATVYLDVYFSPANKEYTKETETRKNNRFV